MDKRLILSRIKQAHKFKTDTELSNFLGISKSTLSNWRVRNSVDYDLLFSKCEDLNLNWLLTGRGEMLKSEEKTGGSIGVVPHTPQKTPESAPYDIKAFTDLISGFTRQIGDLHEQLGTQINENRHLHEINMQQATRITELAQEIENLEEKVQTLKKESESIERIQSTAYLYAAEPAPASFVKKQKKTGGIPDFHPSPSNPKCRKIR